MGRHGANPLSALGFVTVVRSQAHGLFGGYLILNSTGRPLEFHCTAPVKPTRAQEILYGPTLEPYLYGEQIGRTLVGKSNLRIAVLCTDKPQMFAVREFVSLPTALVLPQDDSSTAKSFRIDPPHSAGPEMVTFRVGRNQIGVPADNPDDRQRISASLASLSDSFDLSEPFGRIREAIKEAHRTTRQVGRGA